jgi:enamine deaminase RidA (YjgF/YER057c/UK114 family)
MNARKSISAVAAALALSALPGLASAQVTKIKSNPNAFILDAADVKAGTDMIFVSGQLPAPVDPAKPMAEIKSIEDYGDSKTQTISVLGKIRKILESRGYAMADVVKMTLFIAADPKLGKIDFAGVNEGFRQFFGPAENPSTTARSAFQVANLVGPYFLIEIEAIAAKKK